MEIRVVKMTNNKIETGREVTGRDTQNNKIMKPTSTSEQVRTKVLSQKIIKMIKSVKYGNLCYSIWHLSLIQLLRQPALSLLLNIDKK